MHILWQSVLIIFGLRLKRSTAFVFRFLIADVYIQAIEEIVFNDKTYNSTDTYNLYQHNR